MKKIIIVGAGVAGLSFAYECLRRKYSVMVVEAASEVGGLAKSLFVNGCYVDVGVHIMYLKDPEVYRKVKEIVDRKYWIKVVRNGKLYISRRYIDWPLSFHSFHQFPFNTGAGIIFDQLKKAKYISGDPMSYEHELLKMYGPALYYSFFQPLTLKFLHTDPKQVHLDWAYSTLRASTKIEDKSFRKNHTYHNSDIDEESKKDFNIIKFAIQSLTTNKKDEPFYYFRDGFGMLVGEYEKKVTQLGGIIKKNSLVNSFRIKNNTIETCIVNNKVYHADAVIWTGNPFALTKLLGYSKPNISFLNSKYVYLFLKRCNKDYQVCYYADKDVSFVRTSIFSNHSKTIIRNPKVKHIACLEYSFASEKDMASTGNLFKRRVIQDTINTDIINNESDIESIWELNVPRSYPILTLDYRRNIQAMNQKFEKFSNLVTFGRQATFSYNNSDIIIKETLHHPWFNGTLKKSGKIFT